MKKRLMIFCSLISLLLVGFQFPIYGEEDPSDTPSSVPVPNSIRLDAYFFDNYDLLPYIESDGQQYIDSGILGDNNLKIDLKFSDLKSIENRVDYYLFGGRATSSNSPKLNVFYRYTNGRYFFNFDVNYFSYATSLDIYNMHYLSFDKNVVYIDNNLINTFVDSEFNTTNNIYIFASSDNSSSSILGTTSAYKLYNFSIYDYDTESYVRYYYPARSKSGGIIGLYDAVSDTFVTTSGSVPFASPIPDQVLNLQIGSFLTAGLGWIGDILEFAVETPIIIIFMAIGLAGAMFRWGRRLVHF